jgi:hypothetical protein
MLRFSDGRTGRGNRVTNTAIREVECWCNGRLLPDSIAARCYALAGRLLA